MRGQNKRRSRWNQFSHDVSTMLKDRDDSAVIHLQTGRSSQQRTAKLMQKHFMPGLFYDGHEKCCEFTPGSLEDSSLPGSKNLKNYENKKVLPDMQGEEANGFLSFPGASRFFFRRLHDYALTSYRILFM